MPVLYEDADYEVRQGWFSGWRVRDKQRQATVVPDTIYTEKVGFAWPKIRLKTSIDKRVRNRAEDILMWRLASAACDPTSSSRTFFFELEPDDIANVCLHAAELEFSALESVEDLRQAIFDKDT